MFGWFCFQTITRYLFQIVLPKITRVFSERGREAMLRNAAITIFLVFTGVYEPFLLHNALVEAQVTLVFKRVAN